jgi:N-acetylmuramoyl-L-alanine amidase
MKRHIHSSSTSLSFLTIVVFLFGIWSLIHLENRATWSGEPPPTEWRKAASDSDMLQIEGLEVAYWGRPDAAYSKYATRKRRKPVAIVVHHTSAKPVKNLVTYGHISDPNRGGGAFGYHFYIGRDGHIVQGAPLSRRTNHIKFKTNKQRRETAKHLWSGNTIGVTLVGGCDPLMRPDWKAWQRCTQEFATPHQLRAGAIVIRALQARFSMKCAEVYGHGDLQYDRESFEGVLLSRLVREACAAKIVAPPPVPVEAARSGGAAATTEQKRLAKGS